MRSHGATPSAAIRTRRRDAKQRRDAMLGAILDGAPDPVVVVDGEQRLLYANPACDTLFGTAASAAVGRRISEFGTIADDPADAGKAGVRRGHAEIRLPSGEQRWLAYTANELELADGGGRVAVVFLRDETERRGDELRLSRLNAELEQTIRSLAHDLRSPLVSVLGFSRLLREDFAIELGERGAHFLERIHSAGRSMEQLIRDMLDFARIGHGEEIHSTVDPREVLQQLKGELKPRLDQDDVALVVPTSPPLLRCDRTRLYQLLSNLIGNALDHMGPVAKPRIEVEIREQRTRHEIVVRDNGRGVAPEQAERIFELFHTVPHPGGRKGTGIGLAIVRKIAELHGGRAFVESPREGGAAFHVVLPRS